jgi:acyl-CoA synthetase (AMP-forming)/AMP-acid ligase II
VSQPEFAPLLLDDILRTTAGRTPDRPALSLRGEIRTFAETEARRRHLAAVLQRRGIGPGARVTFWSDVNLDAPALYYALASIGAVFVPLNPRFNKDEAGAMEDLIEPHLRITDGNHEGDVELDALLAERTPSTFELPAVAETDPEVIYCTSGTTGTPKGVLLSHRAERLRLGNTARGPGAELTMVPMFHWGGWATLHGTWYMGNELVLFESAEADVLLRTIVERQVRSFYAIPAVWRRILAEDLSRYDLSSLTEANTGTSATPLSLLQAIHAALPHTVSHVRYGATEVGGLANLAADQLERKPGSVGLPSPGVHVKFVEGELWARSPQMSLGYWRNPEANAAAFVDGWYRTGDLVERDDEGYLYVVGRVKDLIRTGGEFVAPPEVDNVLLEHPSVADGAVAGLPHPDWGEIVAAFVVLRPGTELNMEELRQHCMDRLASFKHPRRLYLVEAIPRTGPTGQVQRRRLVELAVDQDPLG